jgi:hypothetical protein
MGIRECDVINHLKFKQTMTAPSDCNAVLTDGRRLEVLLYQNRPIVEIENQFFHAQEVLGFARYEKKPVAASIPEAPVQLPDKPVKDEPIAGSESVQMAERWNSSQLYKRNLVRESFGVLNVEHFIGRDPQNPNMKYYRCKCGCGKRDCYVVASQADLLMQRVNSCRNKKPIPPGITNDSPRLKAGLF